MDAAPRRATLKALAKINLNLEILNRRPDGYHNLRTVFQTISLSDKLVVEYTPSRSVSIKVDDDLSIPDNLVVRAAEAVMKAAQRGGRVTMRLVKKIPMGGGLGGGSTDAASILLALPVLLGKHLPLDQLMEIGGRLGSDVPFFLMGGTGLGLDRGTELYPIADAKAGPVLLIAPGLHISTAEAYAELGRSLTSPEASPKINISQSLALALSGESSVGGWADFCRNDFESVVFRRHPQLAAIKRKLQRLGARPALMTGSGATLFGIFDSVEQRRRAKQSFGERVLPVSFVSRARYHSMWWKQLGQHIQDHTWPPQSRYAR